ncbi:hypothetical protein [Nakamurella aerolata]|nr:hypothetical protein [Nakamurella aerolata]
MPGRRRGRRVIVVRLDRLTCAGLSYPESMEWWVWVIIVVVVLLIIAGVVGYIQAQRRRGGALVVQPKRSGGRGQGDPR